MTWLLLPNLVLILDKSTQDQLNRGQRLQEILKQVQYAPMSLSDQIIVLYAGTNGYADKVSVGKIKEWEIQLLRYLEMNHPEIGKDIEKNKRITEENEELLGEALKSFNITWKQ